MDARRAMVVRSCMALLVIAAPLSAQDAPPPKPSEESSSLASVRQEESTASSSKTPSLRSLPKNILLDQKRIWLAPLHIHRQQSVELAIAGGITGAVISIDHFVAGGFASSSPQHDGMHSLARSVGRFSAGEYDLLVAGGFYAFGHFTRDERARATGVLGARAVLNTILLTEGLKRITRRSRPSYPNGMPLDDAKGEFFNGGRSFPSGHASEAWALATVVAGQYRHRRWVPWVAYGLATSVALSRVPARKHFPSDVLVGSALGFLVGRYVWRSAQPDSQRLAERRWQALPFVPSGGGAAFSLALSF
jgi:membrane-associated phospholipid phosphatase